MTVRLCLQTERQISGRGNTVFTSMFLSCSISLHGFLCVGWVGPNWYSNIQTFSYSRTVSDHSVLCCQVIIKHFPSSLRIHVCLSIEILMSCATTNCTCILAFTFWPLLCHVDSFAGCRVICIPSFTLLCVVLCYCVYPPIN